MTKRLLLMAIALIAITGSIFGTIYSGIHQQMTQASAYAPPPVAVEIGAVESSHWSEQTFAVGDLRAWQDTSIAARINGEVQTVLFQSGDRVSQGQVLVRLNSDEETAQLERVKAQLTLAELEYQRNRELRQNRVISQTQLDKVKANLDQARAQKQELEARISKKSITAPFAGQVGLRNVDVGDYLGAGTLITSLQDLSKLYVDFTIPEQYAGRVEKGMTIILNIEATGDESFTGKVIARDAKLDLKTRNLKVRAQVNNPNKQLLPGMFASITLILDQSRKVLTLPETAIAYSSFGHTVYAVREGEKGHLAFPVFVKTGENRNNRVEILSGLNTGDEVVLTGQLKLYPGVSVKAVEAGAQ